jgi:hypothetical protein
MRSAVTLNRLFIGRSGPRRLLARGRYLGLFLSTALLTAQCQEALEEVTDVRVTKQVPDAGNCGILPTTITIEFSMAMDTASLSSVNTGTACTASVQVSNDDFATCVNFSANPTTSDSKAFVFTPTAAFSATSNYKIRVTKAAKSSSGNALANVYTSAAGFGAQAQLLITEVGMCRYTNRSCWFEIYNQSSQCNANLADYKIKASYVDSVAGGNAAGTETFDLPELTLSGGSYLAIRGNATNGGEYINGAGQIYVVKQTLGGADRLPWWTQNGYIEIIKGTSTIDFVRFGTNAQTPTSGGAASWTDGTLPTMWASSDANYGKSIARSASLADTNTGNDWVARDFATPGAPNDVTCTTDADSDGIPDCSEVSGSTYAGLNLYAMGARTGQKDVFIEVDYMDSTDPGVIPQRAALDKVKAAFAAKGYKLHFDVGDLFHQADGINEANHDLGNASAKVPFAQGIELGAAGDKANFFTYKAGHMDIRRRNIFYYMLFAYSRNADGSAGSSGVAEINGNDSIISLGNWGLVADSNRLINYQASTVMHEWGHNLGLYHGGGDSVNYKPNYFSIMNYHYQLSGLPTLNDNPGDRYYLYRRNTFGDCSLVTSTSQLTNNFNSASFKMDYSDGAGSALNEASITESSGLYRSGSSAIDYNCNGNSGNSGFAKDLNGEGGNTSLTDHDDWGTINVIFLRKYSGSDSGYFQTSGDGDKIHINPIGNDRQPVIDEPDMAWAREQ